MASETNLEEDILSLIFTTISKDDWKDDPNVHSYLSELSTYGIHKLANEPARLAEEKSALLEQIQELTFANYKTFIQAAQCSQEIVQEFGNIENNLQSLLETLPAFKAKCHQFENENKEISSKWREASLALSKHPQLLEILEVPQLMDTCVRNNHYEEALELSAYVRSLGRKHASIPLIKSICDEVEGSVRTMLNQLLGQLGSHIQLAAAMKVIGFLRRLGVFSETQLRITFLRTRDAWFQGLLKAIPKVDGYSHLTKTMDLTRVHLFDIVTQYRATFSTAADEDPLLFYGGSKTSIGMSSAILPSWLALKISQFLQTLEEDLKAPDMAEKMGAVLGSAMFFGLSCSRVGADIRPLMVPVFHKAIYDHFSSRVQEATQSFQKTMETFTLTAVPYYASTFLNASKDSSLQNAAQAPPLALIEFAPLAQYCNAILSTFNVLRQCAPLPLAPKVASCMQGSLETLAQSILSFSKSEESTLTAKEQVSLSSLCSRFANDLIPHLDHCLSAIFPAGDIARLMGLSLAEYSKMGLIKLDPTKISKPIEHLLAESSQEELLGDVGITFGSMTENTIKSSTTSPSLEIVDNSPATASTSQAASNDDSLDSPNKGGGDCLPLAPAEQENAVLDPVMNPNDESLISEQNTKHENAVIDTNSIPEHLENSNILLNVANKTDVDELTQPTSHDSDDTTKSSNLHSHKQLDSGEIILDGANETLPNDEPNDEIHFADKSHPDVENNK